MFLHFVTCNNSKTTKYRRRQVEYQMIVSNTLFSFKKNDQGSLALSRIRFLQDKDILKSDNDVIILSDPKNNQCFINGSIPLKKLSQDQICFVAEVSKYFTADELNKSIWLGVDGTENFLCGGVYHEVVFSDIYSSKLKSTIIYS